MADQPGAGSWEVGPLRRAMPWIVAVVVTVVGILVPVLVVFSGGQALTVSRAAWSVGWAGIAGVMLSVALRTVIRLDVRADGRIEARRPIGTITIDAHQVVRIRRSTPSRDWKWLTRIETADRTVRLEGGFPGVPGIVTAIRVHNPHVVIQP